MPSPISALGARLRSSGGRLVRRLGLLPGGEPDGLGDDERLEAWCSRAARSRFPRAPRNAYQLEQWLCPLEALAEQCGVAVITQDSRTAVRLRERTTIPVLCVGRTATLDRLVQRSSIALALYVSHHPRNFQMLRFPSVAHVYLGHGESDKAVSASNQLKAYDRVFVAGPAAEERVQTGLMWFDASRMVRIGRPQATAPDPRPAPDRPTVLYAPTWRAQPSMACCSVLTHGRALVESLVAAGLRVVYRPHPRTGANRRDVAAADAALRALFATDDMRNGGHTVDTDEPLTGAFAGADLLITDVSSLAVEWLPTGRPLIVTVPAKSGAVVTASPLLDLVPRLPADEAGRAGELALRCLVDDPERDRRGALLEHYLGGDDPAGALVRFLDARATTSSPHGTPRSPVPARPRDELRTTGLAEHPLLRQVTQPPAIRGRRSAEHWTGDLYMRRISPYLTRLLIRAGLTANAVTCLMIVTGAASGFALLIPGLWGAVLAVLLTQPADAVGRQRRRGRPVARRRARSASSWTASATTSPNR